MAAAALQAGRARSGVAAVEPAVLRRSRGQPVSALLKRTQGERLRLIEARSRAMAADDARNLLLERLGLIARVGGARPHPLRGHSVIAWTITEAGRAALAEIEAARG
jgi:hypothetical protein